MTRLPLIAIVAATLAWGPAAPASAEAEPDEDASTVETESSEEGEEADASDDNEETSDEDEDSDAFPAPGPYRVAVGLSGGRLSWDTPHGSREGKWMYGINGRFVFWEPMFATLTVDHSRYAPEAGDLVVANRHITTMAGVGAELWMSPIRFAAELQGGAVARMLDVDDRAGTEFSDTRLRPALGFNLEVGTGIFGTSALNFFTGARGYAPGRLDIFFGLRFEWIFSNRDREENTTTD